MLDSEYGTERTWDIASYYASSVNTGNTDLERLCQERDFAGLAEYSLEYHTESDLQQLIKLRQVKAVFQKNAAFCNEIDAEVRAYFKFMEAEDICRDVNNTMGERLSSLRGWRAGVIHTCMSKISKILRDVPDFANLPVRFSSGATTTLRRGPSGSLFRMRDVAVNPSLYCVVEHFFATLPHVAIRHGTQINGDEEAELHLDISYRVTSGRLSFVPKTYKVHRSICVEPTWATVVQLGYGGVIRERLSRYNDIPTGQDRNRRLARDGSVGNHLATIDFSMASDTISRELVYALLPFDWASALWQCRTGTVYYGDCPIHLQKWSSMGNGYTFELETLIFYALALSCVEYFGLGKSEDVSVYGDDVILPSQAAPYFMELTEILGLIPNKEKTYVDGPFRESCGADYFRGVDIRPWYLKGTLTVADLFRAHNFHVRRCETAEASFILSMIPDEYRTWGPDGYGDGHLLGSWKARLPGSQRRNGYEGGYFMTWRRTPLSRARPKFGWRLEYGDFPYPSFSAGSTSEDTPPSDPYGIVGEGPWVMNKQYTLSRGVLIP